MKMGKRLKNILLSVPLIIGSMLYTGANLYVRHQMSEARAKQKAAWPKPVFEGTLKDAAAYAKQKSIAELKEGSYVYVVPESRLYDTRSDATFMSVDRASMLDKAISDYYPYQTVMLHTHPDHKLGRKVLASMQKDIERRRHELESIVGPCTGQENVPVEECRSIPKGYVDSNGRMVNLAAKVNTIKGLGTVLEIASKSPGRMLSQVPSSADVETLQAGKIVLGETGRSAIILANESDQVTLIWYDADIGTDLAAYRQYIGYLARHPDIVNKEGLDGVYRVAGHCGVNITAETLK